MHGSYTPSQMHSHAGPRTHSFGPVSRFSFGTETSGCQVVDSDTHETRKRSRYGDTEPTTQRSFATEPWGNSALDNSRFLDTKSPPPLAHDRYELAGGEMGQADYSRRQVGNYDDYFALQKQRGNWSIPPTPQTGARQLAMDGVQAIGNEPKPWTLLGLVGGVAGKLIQFCTVPFRGFQAGSGQKYNVEANSEVAVRLGLQDDPFSYQSAGPVQRATPGDFPSENYGVLSVDSLDNEHAERPRMTKRLRTADNWVVVGDDGETDSRPSTPRLSVRRVPDHSQSPSQIPRATSKASVNTPLHKRPSLIPVSRRSTVDRRSFTGSARPSLSQSRPRSYSRTSYGSPVMVEDKAKKPASPLPKESQRLINKVRREEMEEDARMRRMSSQMSAMLREAKEALGSKFEIEDEYLDDSEDALQQSGYFPQFS